MPVSCKTLEEKAQSYTAAWNSGRPEAVADHYADDGQIVINRGDPSVGHAWLTEMAAGFHAAVPNLHLTCDAIRFTGNGRHAVYLWTFTGHDSETGNPLRVSGWEEWDLADGFVVTASRGWFDAEDYDRQIAGN